jgi:hypothetical protein
VRTDARRRHRLILVLLSVGLVIGGATIVRRSSAPTDAEPTVGSAALPDVLAGSTPPAHSAAPGPTDHTVGTDATAARRIAGGVRTKAAGAVLKPGVPVSVTIPFASSNHPQGVHATVQSHHLNSDQTLFVPADPEVLSWARDDAKPGSDRGTAIITGHINYVIDGQLVHGALSDLAEYAHEAIGRKFTVRTADGRTLSYRIVAGREYTKAQLARDPHLRTELYDQSKVYGPVAHPSGRLLLVSCGGDFDPNSGEYEDNVFLYALPVV